MYGETVKFEKSSSLFVYLWRPNCGTDFQYTEMYQILTDNHILRNILISLWIQIPRK